MSVVGSDWEKLKRFNIAELYPPVSKPKTGAAFKAEAVPTMPEAVTTDEGLGQQPSLAERLAE